MGGLGGSGTEHATRASPHTFSDSTKEPYRGKFAPIPASSRHSQPSQARCLLGSCQRRPILPSFHRRSIGGANQISRGEEIGEGLAPICGPSSFFSPFHVLSFTLFCTHTFRDTLPCEGQERGLPWETEAWVKEGCWQRRGLTHLLAVTRLSPSL